MSQQSKDNSSSSRTSTSGDRFIPLRPMQQNFVAAPAQNTPNTNYQNLMYFTFFGENAQCRRKPSSVLKYVSSQPTAAPEPFLSELQRAQAPVPLQFIPHEEVATLPKPFRMLDAPGLTTDVHANPLCWSKSGLLAVILADSIYLYHYDTAEVINLYTFAAEDEQPTSLSWLESDPSCLIVGLKDGKTVLFNVETKQRSETSAQNAAIYAITNSSSNSLIVMGYQDGKIRLMDRRAKQAVCVLSHHTETVCGLSISNNGYKLASGGDDKNCFIWDLQMNKSTQAIKKHTAAVKALQWHPTATNMLVTGGGQEDNMLYVWNTYTASDEPLRSQDAGSEVCALHWSSAANQLVTTLGAPKTNIKMWKLLPNYQMTLASQTSQLEILPSSTTTATSFTGSALSPDGTSLAAASSGNEVIHSYKLFNRNAEKKVNAGAKEGSLIASRLSMIR